MKKICCIVVLLISSNCFSAEAVPGALAVRESTAEIALKEFIKDDSYLEHYWANPYDRKSIQQKLIDVVSQLENVDNNVRISLIYYIFRTHTILFQEEELLCEWRKEGRFPLFMWAFNRIQDQRNRDREKGTIEKEVLIMCKKMFPSYLNGKLWHPNKHTPLGKAVMGGDCDKARTLLEQDANPNVYSAKCRPLNLAIHTTPLPFKQSMIEILLSFGADKQRGDSVYGLPKEPKICTLI